MNLTGISEIVAGLVMQGKLAPTAVNPRKLEAPYDSVIQILRDGGDQATLIDRLGVTIPMTISAAVDALGDDVDVGRLLSILDRVSLRQEAGTELGRYSKLLLKGEEIDIGKAYSTVSRLDNGMSAFCTMDEVKPEDNIWIPTCMPMLDKYLGGMPRYGLILLAGPAGTGKSTLLAQIMDAQTKCGKEFGLFSFEMTKELYLARWLEINPKLTKKQRSLVTVTDITMDFDEAYARIAQVVAAHPNIYSIGIDFADLMIPRGHTESTEMASMIYLQMANIAKLVRRPIWLLTALSRNYVGGEPHVTDIRWSGMAEHDASMILLVYNPDQIHADMGQKARRQRLPYVEGKAYIIQGKSRFGYHMGGMGAIQTNWLKKEGWDAEGCEWFGL